MSSHILWKTELGKRKKIMEKLLHFFGFLLLCSQHSKRMERSVSQIFILSSESLFLSSDSHKEALSKYTN